MAIDPSRIVPNAKHCYTPGEIIFVVGMLKTVHVAIRHDYQIVIHPNTKRPSLVRHAALIMRQAFGVNTGFDIEVKNSHEIRHCGLGSSSGLIASVSVAINELFGNPIDRASLIRYLAQNHGEEIDGDQDYLEAVQCIGGSAAAGLIPAGVIVLAGESRPIATMNVPKEYSVIIGIPSDFHELDARSLMSAERKNMHKFISTGKKYGPRIAYRILHEVLPAMTEQNLGGIGDVIYDYRFNMGSIRNCSFVYQGLMTKSLLLARLKRQGVAEVLALSSVGPAFFAVTKRPSMVRAVFRKAGLTIHQTTIHNDGYVVISRS